MGVETLCKEVEIATNTNETNMAERKILGQLELSLKSGSKHVISNWKFLIQNIDPLTLLEELDRTKILVKKNFVDIKRKKRSHQASLVLIAACKKIDDEHVFAKFQTVLRSISVPCADKLSSTFQNDLPLPVDETIENYVTAALQQDRTELEDKLHCSDFLEIVNDFFEASVFDLSQMEKLVCSYPNREAATHLVDMILSHVHNGSIACLMRTLNESKRSRKFRSFLSNINSPFKKENQDLIKVQIKKEMLCTDTCTITDKTEGLLIIDFGDDDVHQKLISSKEPITVEIAKSFNSCVEDIRSGSIVVVLKYLDNKIIEKIKTNINNGSIPKCLDALLNNKLLQGQMPQGKMTIDVTLKLSSKNSVVHSDSQHQSKSVNIITLNKKFLIEEIDTILISNALRRRGYIKNTTLQSINCRRLNAEIIVNILESMDILDVLQILNEEEMPFAFERLQKCKQSYESYTPSLHQIISRNLQCIASKLDYEVARETFVERLVLTSELFDFLDNMFEDEKDKTIAILIEVVKSNSFAVSSLIDVMFMCGMDSLVQKILLDALEVNRDTTESEKAAKLNVTENSSGENIMLFRGVYTVDTHIGKGVQLTPEQLQTRIRHSWGSLVHMDLSYLCQKLLDVNFLSIEDLNHLGNYSRLHQRHNILITIHRHLKHDMNVKVFLNVIQDSMLKQFAYFILTFGTSQQLVLKRDEIQRHKDILEIQRSILQKKLSQRNMIAILYHFIERSVFDVDTLEHVINQPVTSTIEKFVNNVISHAERGACQCLYDSLKDDKFCHRFVHFINAMNLSDNLSFKTRGKPSVISANRNFLIEEIDADNIMPEFEKMGINNFCGLMRKRSVSGTELAKQFLSILEQKTVLEKPFLEILEAKQMHFILNRLTRYRDVYERCTDMSTLRKLISNNILDLVECLDIDDIKQQYIERKMASQQVFENIESKYKGRTDQLIAVIIATLNSGENAVLTLLGVLNGIRGDIFNAITDAFKDQSTSRHDVSRESLGTDLDSAFGSRQASLQELDCSAPEMKDRCISQKTKSRMSSQMGSILKQTEIKDASFSKMKELRVTSVKKGSPMSSRIPVRSNVKDASFSKKKELRVTSVKTGSPMSSRIPVRSNVKELPKEGLVATYQKKKRKKTVPARNSNNQVS